jgi:hypothetical protein
VIAAPNTPEPNDKVYIKIIDGANSVLIYTTNKTTLACVDGYTLETGPIFKGEFSELNLNPALPKLRINNPDRGT